jgi:hypothetical protein
MYTKTHSKYDFERFCIARISSTWSHHIIFIQWRILFPNVGFCLIVLEFELRALCLLGRQYNSWALPPAFSFHFFFQVGSHIFAWSYPQTMVLLSCSWDHRHVPPRPAYWGGGVSLTFCLGGPQTMILLITDFQVARITGISHHTQACFVFNWHITITYLGVQYDV